MCACIRIFKLLCYYRSHLARKIPFIFKQSSFLNSNAHTWAIEERIKVRQAGSDSSIRNSDINKYCRGVATRSMLLIRISTIELCFKSKAPNCTKYPVSSCMKLEGLSSGVSYLFLIQNPQSDYNRKAGDQHRWFQVCSQYAYIQAPF